MTVDRLAAQEDDLVSSLWRERSLMRGIGWPELVIILVVVIVLFGASRLPVIARSIGSSAREFRKGLADDGEQEDGGDAGDGKA